MIIAFTGTPGSGKTYEAVKKMLDNLKIGRRVYTNIDGVFDPECLECTKLYTGLNDYELNQLLYWIPDHEVEQFWLVCKPGSLIILDEAQKFFSNRDWASEKNKEFARWASTHRHEGFDLVIITQAAARIDSAVRALFEWNYIFRKVNFFGGAVQRKYLCFAYSGEDTSGQPLSRSVRNYQANVFNCYKSYVSGDIKELSIMKHVNVLKHPVFFAIPVVIGFCIYMVFFRSSLGTGDVFGHKSIGKDHNSKPTVKSAVSKTSDRQGKFTFTTLDNGNIYVSYN